MPRKIQISFKSRECVVSEKEHFSVKYRKNNNSKKFGFCIMIGVCSENAREHADAEKKVAAFKNKQA